MADNMIKDFVKKQTTAVNIGVPKQRPAVETPQARIGESEEPAVATAPTVATVTAPVEEVKVKGHVGRPKSEIEKVKLSLYVPAEAKEKLVRIQHENYKPNMNDVLLEAINDLLKKYGK